MTDHETDHPKAADSSSRESRDEPTKADATNETMDREESIELDAPEYDEA